MEFEPWLGDATPVQAARRMWFNLTEDITWITNQRDAVERAEWDPEAWDALHQWAMEQDSLGDSWKVALHDLWLRGRPSPPRKTDNRDRIIVYIMRRLCETYGLNPTQTQPGGPVACAAAVVATLPGAPSEGRVANIWSAANAKRPE